MYSYEEAMKEDIREAIRENYDIDEYRENIDELEEKLNEDLWIDDSVTGNASGSYTFSRTQAREYVIEDGMNYIKWAVEDFGIESKELGERFINEDWEWIDVTIPCYLLGQIIHEVLEDLDMGE